MSTEQEDNTKHIEAEQYHLKALHILNQIQANIKVYGPINSIIRNAPPVEIKTVNLALQYIDRSLEYFPKNTKFLNLKALLLSEGIGDTENALVLLKKASELNPRDIDIQNNLKSLIELKQQAGISRIMSKLFILLIIVSVITWISW